MLSLDEILFAGCIAIFAMAYCWILTDPDMLLERPYVWMKGKLEGKYDWLWNPIWGCPKCVAGQIALWTFIYYRWDNYDPVAHMIFTGVTIFLTRELVLYYIKQAKQ